MGSVRECDPMKMKNKDERPHFISRRYAEFSAGLLSVNDHSGLSDKVSKLLSDLQQEVENFVLRMASTFADERKKQLIFLINNYDMILSILTEKVHNPCREIDCFKDLLSTRTSEYVEHILRSQFGSLIHFVLQAEALLSRNDEKTLRGQSSAVSKILREFNDNWKRALDSINGEVLTAFPNFKNGTAILQQCLTQFVQYYHRFYKIMSSPEFSAHPDRAQLINVHQLMVEVKKYKPNF